LGDFYQVTGLGASSEQDPKDDSIVLLVVVLHLLVLDPPENRVQRRFRRALSAVAALQASGEAGGTQYALK
jgi:hypothetical protein